MYASTSPFSQASRQGGALYRRIGVETQVVDASAHRLVAMLFEGLLDALSQARGAMAQGDLAAKGQAIGRAVRIVDEGLKAGLDLRDGGPLAADLGDLYSYIELRLTQANLRNDEAALLECRQLVLPLRDAWASIGPQVDRGGRA